jgi:hypothetical protein
MKARSKRKRESARTFTDGKRRNNPLPLGKLTTDAPVKKPTGDRFNQLIHRGKPRPWFDATEQLKKHPPHRERREARRAERLKQKWTVA